MNKKHLKHLGKASFILLCALQNTACFKEKPVIKAIFNSKITASAFLILKPAQSRIQWDIAIAETAQERSAALESGQIDLIESDLFELYRWNAEGRKIKALMALPSRYGLFLGPDTPADNLNETAVGVTAAGASGFLLDQWQNSQTQIQQRLNIYGEALKAELLAKREIEAAVIGEPGYSRLLEEGYSLQADFNEAGASLGLLALANASLTPEIKRAIIKDYKKGAKLLQKLKKLEKAPLLSSSSLPAAAKLLQQPLVFPQVLYLQSRYWLQLHAPETPALEYSDLFETELLEAARP